MKVSRGVGGRVGVAANVGLEAGSDGGVLLDDQRAAGKNERGEDLKGFAIGGGSAIDVEVIGVGGGDNGRGGVKAMEGAVVLVGLDDGQVAVVGEHEVAGVSLEDAAEEGVTIHMRLLEQVRRHGGDGRLAVRASYADGAAGRCDESEHLGTFHYLETGTAEMVQLRVIRRDGGGVDHECRLWIRETVGDEADVVVEMDGSAFVDEVPSEGRWGAVVASHADAARHKPTDQGAHPYAASADEVGGTNVCDVNHLFFSI